jgi:Spy/CpxP family protein refolding chaperone
MKTARLILVPTLLMLIAVSLMAQEKSKRKRAKLTPMTQAMMRMARMWETLKELDLTEEQDAKLKGIRDETAPKMKVVMDKLGEIATEDQKKAVEAAAKKAKEDGKKGPAFFAAIQSAVDLTDEQREQMDKLVPEIQAVQRQMMKSITSMLTPEQKEKMKQLRSPRKKKAKKAKKAD